MQRNSTDTVPSVSTDRNFKMPQGTTWLVLDQNNDYGKASPQVVCSTRKQLPPVKLIRSSDGKTVRTITGYIGKECVLK
jgi:hypothetical protein